MKSVSHVKCPNCGEFNTNKEYCESCNTLISHQKKQETRAERIQEKELTEVKEKLAHLNFADRMRKHPFFVFKIFGWMLHSVWIVINIIGGLIAWFVAMVAAG
jgi:ribosomal protein L37E